MSEANDIQVQLERIKIKILSKPKTVIKKIKSLISKNAFRMK